MSWRFSPWKMYLFILSIFLNCSAENYLLGNWKSASTVIWTYTDESILMCVTIDSDWYRTKQGSVWCQINRKGVITIRILLDTTRFRGEFLCVHTLPASVIAEKRNERNRLLIIVKLTEIGLYLPFPDRSGNKRSSIWFQINRKMVNTISFRLI